MNKKEKSLKKSAVCWRQFTRHNDAIFLSLGKEIRIGVLSVATLAFATPDSAAAMMSMEHPADAVVCADEEGLTDSLSVDMELDLQNADVVGTLAPLPADKAVRLVQVIGRKEIESSSANTVNDLLKLAAGVDVRQRGGFGIQTDIGVNGGNADQLTVLLNGVNISNPHTGHLTVDLPVSVDDIERIEVIEGGASRVYGSQAFAGVINIVTRTEKSSGAGANLYGGSYGSAGMNAFAAIKGGAFNNRFSGSYSRSDGASPNSDFEKYNLYWNQKYESDVFDLKMQAGMSEMKYGANTFYGTGSKSQYEENSRYMVSVQGETKGKVHVMPQLYWNRSYDHYVWTRSNPAAYQNYHQTNVYGGHVNAYTTWALGKTAVGVELRKENILSTRLGKEMSADEMVKYPGYKYKDGRTNFGIYLEHDVLLDDVTISLGVLANKNTSVENKMKFYPGVDVSWRVAEGWKVYGSFNQSLHVPTYTDLYYYGPGLQGHADLKPEKSTDFNAGVSYQNYFMSAQVKGFFRKGTDMIDWVKKVGADVYTSDNCDIDNVGAEALMTMDFTRLWGKESYLQNVTLSYCYNYQHRVNVDEAAVYASQLVFLRNKMVASLNHRIYKKLSAQWDFTLKNRSGEFDNALTGKTEKYGTFGNLDVKLSWTDKLYTLYVKGNNITDHKYYDIANVQQPGMWIMGGVKFNVNL